MIKLSFIVPVYNVAPYLRKCVDSLLAQDYDDYEIILVDDGSTDGSGKICDELAEKAYPQSLPSLQGEELRSIEGPVDVHRTTKRGRLPIESIREGEVPGTHEVKWDSEEDTIIITHIAKGRRGFALGAVLAAEELKQ